MRYCVPREKTMSKWVLRTRENVPIPTMEPPDTIVGFVPILPAIRTLTYRLKYEKHYAANYYALRDAIERDQFDRRGGYYQPLEGPLVLYMLYVLDKGVRALHMNKESLFDLDNCDKTFIDALTKTGLGQGTGKKCSIHHIVDDSHIVRCIANKRYAQPGEMAGTWYAISQTDETDVRPEEISRLVALIDNEMEHADERQAFNETNLLIAQLDGQAFLNDEECLITNLLDPTYRLPAKWQGEA